MRLEGFVQVDSMKLKKTVLVLLMFFITGCSVEYTLTINEDKTLDESLTILQSNSLWGSTKTEISYQIDSTLVFAKDETEPAYFYNQEKVLGNANSGVKYSYQFNKDNFISDSEFIRNCFDSYELYLEEEMLNISASGFKCSTALGDDYNLSINIVTDGKVINGNYDKNNENKYTWNIRADEDVSIELTMDLSKPKTVTEHYEENKYSLLIIVSIVLLLCGIILVAYIKNKKNNS